MAWLRRFERACDVVEISPPLLARLGRRFRVEPVCALDAIHLASIEGIEEVPALVAVVTRDRRIADNAAAMGYVVS